MKLSHFSPVIPAIIITLLVFIPTHAYASYTFAQIGEQHVVASPDNEVDCYWSGTDAVNGTDVNGNEGAPMAPPWDFGPGFPPDHGRYISSPPADPVPDGFLDNPTEYCGETIEVWTEGGQDTYANQGMIQFNASFAPYLGGKSTLGTCPISDNKQDVCTLSYYYLKSDLTAGGITPTTATANTPVTLSSTITNNGPGSTNDPKTNGGAFDVAFQLSSNASCTAPTDIGTYHQASALANGGHATATDSYTFTANGTYYVRAVADSNNDIDESNEDNNNGPCTAITVGGGGGNGTDLTAVTGSDEAGDPGSQITLPGTLESYSGSVAETDGFYNLLQICGTDTDGTPDCNVYDDHTVQDWDQNGLGAYPAQLSLPIDSQDQGNVPNDPGGNYVYRWCANNNNQWTNIVTETEVSGSKGDAPYGNNCGGWSKLTVNGQKGQQSLSCKPSPTLGTVGQTIAWTPTYSGFDGTPSIAWKATFGTPSSGNTTGTKPFKDSYSSLGLYSVTADATYQNEEVKATCSPVQIVNSIGGGDCGTTPSATIKAAEPRVTQGTQDTISWTATGIAQGDVCNITGPDLNKQDQGNSSCDIKDSSGSAHPIINSQSTYTISCPSEAVTASVTVDVVPNEQEF